MGFSTYILVAVFWIIPCVAIGFYITGIGISPKKQYKLGLKTILFSYILGVCMLFVMITFS